MASGESSQPLAPPTSHCLATTKTILTPTTLPTIPTVNGQTSHTHDSVQSGTARTIHHHICQLGLHMINPNHMTYGSHNEIPGNLRVVSVVEEVDSPHSVIGWFPTEAANVLRTPRLVFPVTKQVGNRIYHHQMRRRLLASCTCRRYRSNTTLRKRKNLGTNSVDVRRVSSALCRRCLRCSMHLLPLDLALGSGVV